MDSMIFHFEDVIGCFCLRIRGWIVKRLLSSSLFRYVVGAFIVIGAAAILKYVLIDVPKKETARVAGTGPERLEKLTEVLAKESGPLPKLTEWYPKDLPCGQKIAAPEDEFWNGLGIPVGEATYYQFRLESDEKRYTVLARRDSDCDGLHVVHRVSARLGEEGDVHSHNVGE